MLSLQDCLDYLDLTEEIVEQVAHHEHIPIMCAVEECAELLKTENGIEVVKSILLENIAESKEKHDGKECECIYAYECFISKVSKF